MHRTDRVLRLFRFRQPIPVTPESPLNLRIMDDGTGLSTAPTQSPGPMPQATT
ncbi:hypothetical protein Gotur_010799, partial [Gossypium turneri]